MILQRLTIIYKPRFAISPVHPVFRMSKEGLASSSLLGAVFFNLIASILLAVLSITIMIPFWLINYRFF